MENKTLSFETTYYSPHSSFFSLYDIEQIFSSESYNNNKAHDFNKEI